MIGYIEGYSDTNDIDYCPSCGKEVYSYHADGTGCCNTCGRFGVIHVESEEQ